MVQSQESSLRIGEIAARAGVSVDTVRYYERRGILPTAARLASGYRSYDPASVDRILLARRLRAIGMSIDEVASAMAGHDRGGTCETERWRLEAVRDRVDSQLAELTRLRQLVDGAITACAGGSCILVG